MIEEEPTQFVPRTDSSKNGEEFNFKYVGFYEIDSIVDHISQYQKEWLLNISRQLRYSMHKYTATYFLVDHSLRWKIGDKFSPEIKSDDKVLYELTKPILDDLEQKYNGKVAKVLFIKLRAGKEIDYHYDAGDYLEIVRRLHVALITNPGVIFKVDSEEIHIEKGQCYEVNNNKGHAVYNRGEEERIHILIDIMPQWAIDLGESNEQ